MISASDCSGEVGIQSSATKLSVRSQPCEWGAGHIFSRESPSSGRHQPHPLGWHQLLCSPFTDGENSLRGLGQAASTWGFAGQRVSSPSKQPCI